MIRPGARYGGTPLQAEAENHELEANLDYLARPSLNGTKIDTKLELSWWFPSVQEAVFYPQHASNQVCQPRTLETPADGRKNQYKVIICYIVNLSPAWVLRDRQTGRQEERKRKAQRTAERKKKTWHYR